MTVDATVAASTDELDSEHDFAFDVPGFHEELARLRREHPVARVPFHGGTAYLVTRYEDVEQAFRDEATFPAEAAYRLHSEPVMGRTLQCMTGPEHTRNRALVSPAFRARLMPGYVEPILAPVAHRLVDAIAERGEADLVETFTRQYPFTVITPAPRHPGTQRGRHPALGARPAVVPVGPGGRARRVTRIHRLPHAGGRPPARGAR